MGTTESILSSEETEPPFEGHRESVATTSAPITSHQLQSKQRRLARPQPPHVDTLNGVLLGLPSSGKRTLLQRLQGRDPFDKGGAQLEQPLKDSVTVPYRPPSPTKDRIRLQVQIPDSLDSKDRVDFAIVLINPHHDPKHVAPYLDNVIQSLLLQAGYPAPKYKKKKKKKPATTSETQQQLLNPFCLCLLLNFRDLINTDKVPMIREEDLETAASNILKGYPDSLRKRMVLEYGTTSLLNCFGLSTLHQFIFRSYLQRKQTSLEKELVEVRRELEETSTQAETRQSYSDFLKLLSGNQNGSAKTSIHEKAATTSVLTSSAKPNFRAREDMAGSDKEAPESEDLSQEPQSMDHSSQREGRRRVLDTTTNQKSPTSPRKKAAVSSYHDDAKSALEAFLADDEEDENDTPPPSASKRMGGSNNGADSDDDDDDDDDFYYDEGGTRRGTHVMDTNDDEDGEQETAVFAAPQPKAKKQPSMPSIKETADTESDAESSVEPAAADKKDTDENAQICAPGGPISSKQPSLSDAPAVEPNPHDKAAPHESSAELKREPKAKVGGDDDVGEEKEANEQEPYEDEKKMEHAGEDSGTSTKRKETVGSKDNGDKPNAVEDGIEKATNEMAIEPGSNKAENKNDESPASTAEIEADESDGDHDEVLSSTAKRNVPSQPRSREFMVTSTRVVKGERSSSISSDEEFMVQSLPAPTKQVARFINKSREQRSASVSSDEEFLVAPRSPASKPGVATRNGTGQRSASISSSDDEFTVEAPPSSRPRNGNRPREQRWTSVSSDEDTQETSPPTKSKPGTSATEASNTSQKPGEANGISAEALAAIAAAQREAELMLLQQVAESEEEEVPLEAKPKKKKKDGSDKKKKKKKKAKDSSPDLERAEKKKKKREKQERRNRDDVAALAASW